MPYGGVEKFGTTLYKYTSSVHKHTHTQTHRHTQRHTHKHTHTHTPGMSMTVLLAMSTLKEEEVALFHFTPRFRLLF